MLLKRSILFILTIVSLISCAPKPPPAVYTWNEAEKLNGRVQQIKQVRSSTSTDTDYINFDKQGNITGTKEMLSVKNMFNSEEMLSIKQNPNMNKVLDMKGSRDYQYVTIFDTKGKKIKAISTHKNWGSKKDSTTFEFDKNGLLTKVYDNEPMQSTTIYKYNIDGYVIEMDTYLGKRLFKTNKLSYNKNHWISKNEQVSDMWMHHAMRDSLKYLGVDPQNNWTKMVDGADTITRKITYYTNP